MKMTVKQLIEQLNKIENQEKEVLISVHTSTQVYAVAHTEINPMSGYFHQNDSQVMLYTWLPENMYTVERKKK